MGHTGLGAGARKHVRRWRVFDEYFGPEYPISSSAAFSLLPQPEQNFVRKRKAQHKADDADCAEGLSGQPLRPNTVVVSIVSVRAHNSFSKISRPTSNKAQIN